MSAGRVVLAVTDDDLVRCVSCGLCLPHCPTFRVTGREDSSPRGRIAAMRAVQWDGAPLDDQFRRMMQECVQCRGCEPACPSGVRFGRLMTASRAALHASRPRMRSPVREVAEAAAYRVVLPHPALTRAAARAASSAGRRGLLPRRLRPPAPARARRRSLELDPSPDTFVFRGCVMDTWQRPVHVATVAAVRACGARPGAFPSPPGCCGALHAHAGRLAEARRLAAAVVVAAPSAGAVVVDSAGCGAFMKEYGDLLHEPAARAFSGRVADVSEWVVRRGVPPVRATGQRVVVQDPCHLRHVQQVDGAVRRMLGSAYTLLETADDGLCCGAGGAYAVTQPDLAGALRARKVDAIRTAADGPHGEVVVASANPGCAMHLGTTPGLRVRHPIELLVDALVAPR